MAFSLDGAPFRSTIRNIFLGVTNFATEPDHQRLHNLMRQYFREISSRWMDRIASLDYGPGRTNQHIATTVGLKTIKEELDKFYARYPEFGC